jgi:hypothetical protein
MTHSCKDNHGDIRAKIRQPFSMRVDATKRASIKGRLKGVAKLRSRLAVVYGGFAEEVFGSMFGSSESTNRGLDPKPQFLAKTIKIKNSLKLKSTPLQIKRAITNISSILFDIESQNYIDYGVSAIPESLYVPLNANNSTRVYSKGPMVEWNLRTDRKDHSKNVEFTSRANKPISNFSVKISVNGKLKSKYFEKLHGHFDKILDIDNFIATDKLYPIKDITTEKNGVSFVTEREESSGVYRSIDEGTHVGNIVQNKSEGYIASDDLFSYITPSSIYSEGEFTYKCEVSPPKITPLDSFFFMRAAAPLTNYETDIPPTYDISNIRLEDPSGNLIAKYKDFKITGQQDYEKQNHFHYVTYVSEPEQNLARLDTYHPEYPVLGEGSGYTLSLDIKGYCKYTPFTEDDFNKGFEHYCNLDNRFVKSGPNDYLSLDGAPISTQSNDYRIRPTNGLRISAIEIDNRGFGSGIISDGKLPLHLETVEHGTLLERTLRPTRVLSTDYNNNIYPTNTTNIWKTSPDIDGNIYYSNNKDPKSVRELSERLNNYFIEGHVTLHETQPVQDSGKLQLLFEHKTPVSVLEPVGGDFNFGNNSWSKADYEFIYSDDSAFEVEEIYLSIVARKAPNTPDFPIDIVGYSDDKVLVQTDQIGGFLQNTNGKTGSIPNVSGFLNIDELGLSSESISDKFAYYDKDITDSPAGDHYIIDNTVIVDSTEFKQYTIPLSIYNKIPELGQPQKFTNSKFFESLYVDIYPIPSGASFQGADLVIKYKPASSLQMFTLGYETKKLWNTDTRIHPQSHFYGQHHYSNRLGVIDNIPHAYKVHEDTLKTNYARRWRGSSGSVFGGPFDATEFDFSFENPQFNQPFLLGYYDFNNINSATDVVYSSIGSTEYSGVFNQDLSSSIIDSRGMRFQNGELFPNPNNPRQQNGTTYNTKTINWADSEHNLGDRIIDSFDKAVRVSGVDGYLNFGNVPTASGFSLYTRFSPDITVSGVGYNLWTTGVLASKWDNGQDLEYALHYDDGHLTASARDNAGQIISIKDSFDYENYMFPMSALVTYNADGDNKMKLFTYNERSPIQTWHKLRGESSPFILHSGNSDLTIGYSSGSGVGFNAFVSEIGLSHTPWSGGIEGSLSSDDLSVGRGIIGSNGNVSYQVDAVDSFFASHSMSFHFLSERDNNPLWQFVDEDTDSWKLGAFKYCDFNLDFDVMKLRVGRDYIYHKFYNNGLEYQDIIDLNLPTSLAHASGLAYHSQVENDMLRFHLGGLENRYFSAPPRLSKRFPRGYVVDGDAFRINTVVQHDCDSDILWPDGNKGAKLIVSLYAPSKESELFPTENYGLVNRQSHYLNPEDCWNKITTELTISDIKDSESEPWSYFNRDVLDQELSERYFARDVDQMFVQYDLAYPSGTYSWSEIKIHSLDVSLKDALLEEEKISDELWIYASGEAYREESVDLYADALGIEDHSMWLWASGAVFIEDSGKMPIFTSGCYSESSDLNLYTIQIGSIGTGGEGNFGDMFGSSPDKFPLYVKCSPEYTNASIDLVVDSFSPDTLSLSSTLSLSVYDLTGDNKFSTLNAFVYSEDVVAESPIITAQGSMGMITQGPEFITFNSEANLPLLTLGRPIEDTLFSDMGMHTYNKKPIGQVGTYLESYSWNGTNFGSPISPDDEKYTSVSSLDEIRGVNTICYGGCESSAFLKCTEQPLETHDVTWYSPECVEGGVIRSISTYTNDSVPAFGSLTETYKNHYYGIRKFTNLIPKAPYSVLVIAETGDAEILEVPREISEWEYGISRLEAGDIVPEVAYSGLKVTAENVLPSGGFGYGLTTHKDMLIVGHPQEDLTLGTDDFYNDDDANYVLDNAGKIYVYKKDSEPSGADWTEQDDKAKFILQQQIVLPTGFRRDAYSSTFKTFPGVDASFKAEVKQWYNIGEGRELGHSLDSASRGDKDVIIAGGPGTMWSRSFEPVTPYSVPIAMFIFNNELVSDPPDKNWSSILNELQDRDILFRYFCDPPVVFDIKIILLEPLLGGDVDQESSLDFQYPQPDFVTKHQVHRHYSYRVDTQEYKDRDDLMFNELKDIFETTFPLTENAIHSGIPPLVGIYVDDSRSLGTQAVGYYDNGLRSGSLNKFIDYYKQYTYDNGVLNAPIYGSEAAEGYIQVTTGLDEDWIAQGINCLKALTDIPTLNQDNAFRLLGSDLGKFNNDDSEFNLLPPSGGAVFIFEKDKDDNNFEIVQYIDSPTTYNNDYSDRFGHDVAISDNGKILVVGSPYSDSAVQVWEYNNSYESQLDSYIQNVYIGYLSTEYAREVANATYGEAFNLYKEWLEKSADTIYTETLKQELWDKSSESLRFRFIENYGIKPYRLNKEITYSEMHGSSDSQRSEESTHGGWSNLYNNIPTSRMGYSVDTNHDGTLIAIGCPTDSMGERDSTVTWFRYDQKPTQETTYGGENWQWQNYVNAGAVRLLESRDYYPHDRKVVEFYAFGNLHESLAEPEDASYFLPSMSGMFSGAGYDFRRTVYNEELIIPQDAGLAFIITPEISFQSDEVINNIKQWLSYGDRNLVLVGNDPVYEAGGVYNYSNNIINYILEKLDIKMRIYPSRDAEESLVEPSTDLYYNIRQSTVPEKTMSPIGEWEGLKLKGYGVGDIRFFDDFASNLYQCTETTKPPSDSFSLIGMTPKKNYRDLHSRCELPIITEGDLRAKYWDQCEFRPCTGMPGWINFQHNLAMMYGTHKTEDWGCTACDEIVPPTPHSNNRENSEPIPMFAAYEQLTKTIVVPPVPDSIQERERIIGYNIAGDTTYNFPTRNVAPYSGIPFMWSEASGNFDSVVYNLNNVQSNSAWFNPAEYNGKDAVLQAKLSSSINSFEEFYEVEPEINFIVEEKLGANGSSVVLMAGTATERTDVLLSSDGDINLNLYFNILAKNQFGESKVAQIGGFTQRETYKSGFKDSGIQSSMTSLNIDMSHENVSVDDLRMSGNAYDVGWIANTDQMPSSNDILRLKEFLALGNKKIVITYGKDPLGEANEVSSEDESSIDEHYIQSANVAAYLCEQLGVSMRPLFLNGKNRYASLRDARGNNRLNSMKVFGSILEGFDSASDFIAGGKVQDFTINVDCVTINGQRYCTGYFHDIIPIKSNSATKLASFDKAIVDTRSASNIEPQLRTGITKVSFSVPEKEDHHDNFNLFRLYFSAHLDTALESESFDIYVSNCSRNVTLENNNSGGSFIIDDYGDDGSVVKTSFNLGATVEIFAGRPLHSVDIQIPTDVEQIELFIHSNKTYNPADIGSDQDLSNNRTLKLFAVSGVRIPVDQEYIETKTPITEKYFVTVPGSPEYSYQQDYLREISHPSQPYCETAGPGSEICAEEPVLGYGAGARDIEDGPVVIAQEVYHQAGYFVGRNKSRVTIISDPSIIQGPTIKSEGSDLANRDLVYFLTSLYPHTNFPSPNAGRQYPDFYKIISPERSSPSRLVNAYPDNEGLNHRFGGYESNSLSATSYSDTEGKKQILPVPPKDFVRQPFDAMLSIDSVVDIGKFRKLPRPLQSSTVDAMRKAGQHAAIDQLYEDWYVNNFEVVQAYYASKSKFHDSVDGVVYKDAGYQERIPPVMRATGRDHLDFSFFGSGYPGDLFGYKVTIHDDKIYVGAPFTPYNTTSITKWDDVVANSPSGPTHGTEVGFNGGAGAVYVIEKDTSKNNGAGSTSLEITTGLPWDCVQKIRPEQLSVGFSGINAEQASGIYGNHNYTNEFLQLNSYKSDMFGYDIALESDVLAISAPNHSFDVFFEHTPSDFIRKEFNNQFDISTVVPHDLGFASERTNFADSGVSVLNHGSVFTYENRISDWATKQQSWDEIHKISTLGSGTRIQDSQENIMFGSNISLSRAKRNDGDYILGISAPLENISGNNKAGSVFAYDGMLRKLRPSFPHPDTYISGRVYGDGDPDLESTTFNITNGITPNQQVFQRGRVVANHEGEIFIEVSGQDKLDKGYVTHRPYIKAVRGSYLFGRPIENDMNIFTSAYRLPESGTLPLLTLGPERDSVYNKADLYCYSAVQDSGILNLYASGVPSDYYGSYQTVVDQHSTNNVDKLKDINLHSTMSLVARGGPKRVRRRRT